MRILIGGAFAATVLALQAVPAQPPAAAAPA